MKTVLTGFRLTTAARARIAGAGERLGVSDAGVVEMLSNWAKELEAFHVGVFLPSTARGRKGQGRKKERDKTRKAG